MASLDPFIIAVLLAVLGTISVFRVREPYDRYTTITDLMSESVRPGNPGEETTVRGSVHVTSPATPERTPPEPIAEDGTPALLAWRIRRKMKSSGGRGNVYWKTVEGDLSVGEFTVKQNREEVSVDAEWFTNEQDGTLQETGDPFDTSGLYLDTPEQEVLLGELNPANKFLERLGLTGDDGILTDWDVTISVGRKTTSPDRYQATVIQEGDELLVRGELAETADGLVLRGTEETPLRIADGRLEERADRLRSKALKRVGFGLLLILVSGAVATLFI